MNRVLHFTTNERVPRRYGGYDYSERFNIAEEIGDTGYYINAYCHDNTDLYTTNEETQWQVVTQEGKATGPSLSVSMPSYASISAETSPARITIEGGLMRQALPSLVYAYGEMLKLAAAYAEFLTQAYEYAFAEQMERDRKAAAERAERRAKAVAEERKLREERQERQRIEREKRQGFVATRVEELQWYLDQPMRLRRHGKRSVVMGKVTDIDQYGRMRILSEKGAMLSTTVDALEHFEIKYEGDRTYTVIEMSPPPDGLELRVG